MHHYGRGYDTLSLAGGTDVRPEATGYVSLPVDDRRGGQLPSTDETDSWLSDSLM